MILRLLNLFQKEVKKLKTILSKTFYQNSIKVSQALSLDIKVEKRQEIKKQKKDLRSQKYMKDILILIKAAIMKAIYYNKNKFIINLESRIENKFMIGLE